MYLDTEMKLFIGKDVGDPRILKYLFLVVYSMQEKATPIPLKFIMKVSEDPFLRESRVGGNENPSIWQQWVTASFVVDKSYPLQFLLPQIQWLGMLDENIRQWETKNLEEPSAPNRTSETAIMELSYWYFLSYLWVLGAYEVVRTLSQKVKDIQKVKKTRIFSKEIVRKLVETRDFFAEARVPLAKLEPRKLKDHTTAIAFPMIFPENGFGWRISSDISQPGRDISRRELANAFLDLIKYIDENKAAR